MGAALNAFMEIDGAQGESRQEGFTGQIELQSWEWEVEAESSWTKGSGAAVGKPVPGKMSWEHYWDKSSHKLLQYICGGKSFETVTVRMCKSVGSGTPQAYWWAVMKGVFITKVNQSATEEGNVAQKVEMVFKRIDVFYKEQDNLKGNLLPEVTMYWDISAGKSSL